MKMSLSIMISKVNKLEISTLKNLTRKCSTNFLTWIKIEFEIDRSLDKNQWVNFKRYFMFRNSKMSRHYEAFGTSVTRIWSVVLLLFLFFPGGSRRNGGQKRRSHMGLQITHV